MAIAELSDADVFGAVRAPAVAAPGAPRVLSDADVFGAPAGELGFAPAAAVPVVAAAAAAPASPDLLPTMSDLGPSYAAPAPASVSPGNAAMERVAHGTADALGRIGGKAAEAFDQTPEVLTPAARAAVDKYGGHGPFMVGDLVNQIAHGGTNLIGAVHAGGAALAQGAVEVLGEKGGRDALAALASIPLAETNQYGAMRANRPAALAKVPLPDAPVRPQYVSERLAPTNVDPVTGGPVELNPGHRIQQLIEHDIAENPPRAADAGAPVLPSGAAPPAESAPVGGAVAATGGARPLGAPNQGTPVAGAPPESEANRGAARPLGPAAAAEPGAADNVSAPVGGGEAGPAVPRSVGAAALDDNGLGEVTPAQERAYAATAEGQKLLERQPVGVPDHSAYVPGVQPTDVERLQTVDAARELKALKVTAPDVAQEIQTVADANMDRRGGYHQTTVGSKVDVQAAEDAREAQRAADYPAAFADKTTPDTAPVVQAVKDSLSSPRARQNSQLRQYVAPLLDRLVGEHGVPKITDAEELYGFREDLARMRSKASQVDQPNLQHVSGELGDIIDATDKAIEKAAPGYRAYMDNFAGASRRIDEMRVLQEHEPKLYDAQNRLSYPKFQQMMRQIVDARAARGINPYKSITPETMARLWNLRDDLRRLSRAGELGAAAGSDTSQTLFDMVKNAGKGHAGTITASIVGGVAGSAVGMPAIGAAAGAASKDIMQRMFDRRTLRAQTARGMEILHPTTPLNDLLPGEVEPEVRPAFQPTPAAARPAPVQPAQGSMVLPPGGAPVNPLAVAPEAAPAAAPPTNALLPAASPVRAPAAPARAAAGPAAPEAAAAGGARVPFSFPLTPEEAASFGAGDAAPAAPAVPAARFGGQPSSGALVPAGQLGPVRKVTTPSGQTVDVRYRVVEAKDLIPSHSAEGTPNPAYDQALQPRDRSRMASVLQIQGYANRPNPALLGESPSTSMGAPLGHADMQIKSGNGRAATIQEAYRLGNGNVIRKGIAAAGYDTSGFNQPALYGEIQTPMDHAQGVAFARDAGGSPIAGLSATERAASDAKAVPNDAYSLLRGGDVALARNADFARAFSEALPPGEREGFMTADGEVSAEGATRMRNALTQHAYGSDSLVAAMAEHADPDLKAFGGAMVDAAGDMAKLRAGIKAGTIDPASDLSPTLVEAARFIQAAKRERVSLADAVSQRDAFAAHDPMVEPLLKAVFGPDLRGRMTRSKFADMLREYAANAAVQSGLFGAKESAGEMLAAAGAKYGYGSKAGGAAAGGARGVE